MKYAPPIQLTDEERDRLERSVRTKTAPRRDVLRARIILAAAEGRKLPPPWAPLVLRWDCGVRALRSAALMACRLLDKAHPHGTIHLILGKYATHKHRKVQQWLQRHRRFVLHFTPIGASWLKMVEISFGILQS